MSKKKTREPKPDPSALPEDEGWRDRLHAIIFEAETPIGKGFDIALLLCICASVLVVMLDSVGAIRADYGELFTTLEWCFTLLFSVEYILRLVCVRRPLCYARSFFGVVDLLAVLPTYVGLVIPDGRYLMIVRVLRLLRIFRVFKLVKFVSEADMLARALENSRRKILVFLFTVLIITVTVGSLMYVIEGESHGFTSIPMSVYWAIVTMTTVGFGDIHPETPLGRTLASLLMIVGYSVIAVPTGIVTAEMTHQQEAKTVSTRACPSCAAEGHDPDSEFCKYCGVQL